MCIFNKGSLFPVFSHDNQTFMTYFGVEFYLPLALRECGSPEASLGIFNWVGPRVSKGFLQVVQWVFNVYAQHVEFFICINILLTITKTCFNRLHAYTNGILFYRASVVKWPNKWDLLLSPFRRVKPIK